MSSAAASVFNRTIVPGKTVLVRLQSLAGTGHTINWLRPKQFNGKLEFVYFDPYVQKNVMYREIKKLRTIRKIPRLYT